MTNKEILLNMIENLNEDGLSLLASLFGDMSNKERYNKNTTAERLEEIRLESLQKEQERLIQREKESLEREKESLERARESYREMQDKIENLPKRYKNLFKRLDKVSLEAGHYSMSYDELMLFDDVYNNSLVCGSQQIYLYGFMKGQICEKKKYKNSVNIKLFNKDTLTA